MKILIDSDVIIDFLNNQKSAIDFFKNSVSNNELFISIVSWIEVVYGFRKNNLFHKEKIFEEFLDSYQISILLVDKKVADEYLKVKIELENKKTPLADFDLFIAATAIVNRLTFITRNRRHFRRIKNLILG